MRLDCIIVKERQKEIVGRVVRYIKEGLIII